MFSNSSSDSLIISDDHDVGLDEMNLWAPYVPSIPRNFSVESHRRITRPLHAAHLLEVEGNEKTAANGLEEPNELQSRPILTLVDPGTTPLRRKADLDSQDARIGGVVLKNADLERLNPGECLNDTLIELGLKLWLTDLEISNPNLAYQIHVFSPFFYKKLSEKGLQGGYEGVRNWTKKIDIFRKRYLIVPINEHLHWYLAVIYEPGRVLKNPHRTQPFISQAVTDVDSNPTFGHPDFLEMQKEVLDPISGVERELLENDIDVNPNSYIFILDSLGLPHGQTIKRLSSYLTMEAKCKKFVDTFGETEGKAARVYFQTNSVDCGIYLLHFVRTFMSDPRKYANIILSSPKSKRLTGHKAIWLIDKDFGSNERRQLRLLIETLWKRIRDSAQSGSEDEARDDGSQGEVEFV